MLHRIVRMEQPWAYGTDLRPLDMLDHQVQPIAMDNFDIVVKKEEPWTLRLANREIVQRGKIKRTAKMQDAMFRFREKELRLVRQTLVVYDENLIVLIARFGR